MQAIDSEVYNDPSQISLAENEKYKKQIGIYFYTKNFFYNFQELEKNE